MAHKRTPVLGLSVGPKNLARCFWTVEWISRRLRRERVTQGQILAKGREGLLMSVHSCGEPFISIPVVAAIFDTGLNGVSANTDKARERVAASWQRLELEWDDMLQATAGGNRFALKALIERTNAWIDTTLHPIERSRLLGYLRQKEYSEGRSGSFVQLQIPREIYERATAGIPRGKRKAFIAGLLARASSSGGIRAEALSDLGITDTA